MTLLDILGVIFGSKQDRDVKKILPVLMQVNSFRDAMRSLSDEQLKGKTAEFRQRLGQGETLDDSFLKRSLCSVSNIPGTWRGKDGNGPGA